MRWNHHPNLLPRPEVSWTAVLKAAGVGGLLAVTVWSLAWGPTASRGRRASISDGIGNTSTPTTSPRTDQTPKAVSRGAVTSVAVGLQPDTMRYYEPGTGRSFTIDLRAGTEQVLSANTLNGFVASWWIPGHEQVISSFEHRGTEEYRWYDYTTGSVHTIEGATGAPAIAPDGRVVAFAGNSGEAPDISVAEPNGTDLRSILRTRATDIALVWPKNDLLAMASRRPDRSGLDLTVIAMDGTLTPVLSNREGLEHLWSPDGEKLLFSYFTPSAGVALWYRDGITGADTPLGIRTSARKCAWHKDNTTVTCGVPSTSNLTSDIPSDRTATTDDIVTIDVIEGTPVVRYRATTGTLIGVTSPIMSSSDRYLVFTNMFDKRLYALEL